MRRSLVIDSTAYLQIAVEYEFLHYEHVRGLFFCREIVMNDALNFVDDRWSLVDLM